MREYVLGEVPMDVGAVGVKKVEKKKVMRKAVRVPTFFQGPVQSIGNVSPRARAERHAAMIKEAWAKAGHVVEPVLSLEIQRGEMAWSVRMPSLINGLPGEFVMKEMKV